MFKAPEGKEFKNWLMGEDELKEAHKLVVTKDIELKANWDDVKANPVKKTLDSLFGKENKEELDVGNVNVGDAVMAGDNTTEGDPEGTATSKDGKTRITNFEAHWVGTDEDTVLGTTLDGGYYETSPDKFGRVINHNNTKLHVKYVISGERLYTPGMIKIKLPYYSRAEGYPGSYVEASNIPMPKAKMINDQIDYDADYGKSEYIYYVDGDDFIITNTVTIPAATSGTFLIDYLFPNAYEYRNDHYPYKLNNDIGNMPDMYKFEISPQIFININENEKISKDSKKLYHQVDKTVSGKVYKNLINIDPSKTKDNSEIFVKNNGTDAVYTGLVVEWKPEWGNNLKPENYKDYYYMIYEIAAYANAVYSNVTLKIEDILENNQEQKILGYQFSSSGIEKYTEDFGSKFLPYSSYNAKGGEFIMDKFGPNYRQYSHNRNMYVLVAFKKDILSDQKYHFFINTGKITIKQLNSDDKPQVYTNRSHYFIKYVPLPPKAEFTAPPGNSFSLKKYPGPNYYGEPHFYDKKVIKPADKNEPINLTWTVEGTVRVLAETYDQNYGEPDNLDAYKRKTYKAELTDDYLYTGNDYKRELKSEDYEVNEVGLNPCVADYKRKSRTDIGYTTTEYYYDEHNNVYKENNVVIPTKLYGRKESTGEWVELLSFDLKKESYDIYRILNYKSDYDIKKPQRYKIYNNEEIYGIGQMFKIPNGYTSVKLVMETDMPGIDLKMRVSGTLKPSAFINSMFKQNETSPGNSKLRIRNDGTLRVFGNDGRTIDISSTTTRNENNSRTLDLDLENYSKELYHDTAYWDVTVNTPEEKVFDQQLTKFVNKFDHGKVTNDELQKTFIVPTEIRFIENVKNDNGISLRNYESGTFYDLLPLGVSGIKDLKVYNEASAHMYYGKVLGKDAKHPYEVVIHYKDKDKNKPDKTDPASNWNSSTETNTFVTNTFVLSSNYELIENWQNTGRTLLIVKYDNAELVIPDEIKNSDKPYLGDAQSNLRLSYDMIYPWDSYKDYGGKLYNFVAFESGRDSMESGLPDVPNFEGKTEHHKIANEALKDLNKDNDNKNFLYAMDETTVSGNTSANTGLTKHIKDSNDPKYSLATKTKEGGQYSYRIRMQSLSGTTTSGLIFYDSIENYDPLKTDEDYGVKRWRGTLENIDLSHAMVRGADPKVYISTLEGLNIQESKDITDTKIWKLYKKGDDLSKVHAIAVDLRHRPDGSEFKLKEEESVNITLNMRVPWNVKEHQIDPESKALNEIYANTTITTDLNNQSTNKLINTAYTAIKLEPVSTEINLNATKKYLDTEGKEIVLKGDEFTFELKDAEGKVLQTKTNDNKGNITFDPIKYNSWDVGEHTYKIAEVKCDNTQIDYDSHEEVIKVKVERAGDSELKSTVIYDDDGPNFLNQDKKSASLKIIKKDNRTGKLLESAEYLLSKKDDKTFTPVKLITNKDGESQIVENLATGKYVLKETKAPQGYRLNTEEYEFKITDKDLGTVIVKEVEDRLKADMPTTGTSGKVFFAITINLIVLAGIGLYKRKTVKEN